MFILYVEFVCCIRRFIPTTSDTSEFTKIAVDSTGENVYVGGKNILYHLNADLTEQRGFIETGPKRDSKICRKDQVDINDENCDIEKYNDYIKLLQVYESNILVTCSTLFLGRCVGRDLQNISSLVYVSTAYVVVNTEEADPTEGVIVRVDTKPVLIIGKSYVQTSDYLENNEKVRNILYAGQLDKDDFMVSANFNENDKKFSIVAKKNEYAFVVKGIFYMSSSNSVYTLMQIITKATKRAVSKVSKMCANVTAAPNTYQDIPIECNGFSYIQDGTVVQHDQGQVLVALFSETEDVTASTPCAVCVYTEDELLEGFRESRIRAPSCGNPKEYPTDYLKTSNDRQCPNCMDPQGLCGQLNETNYCSAVNSNTFSNMVGVVPLKKTPLYHERGLTSVGAGFRNDLTTILVGTQSGTLRKLYLKSPDNIRVLTTMGSVNMPIKDIITTRQNKTYLLTKYSVGVVDDHGACTGNTCGDCMKNEHSKCGWCVLPTGRCTQKNDCDREFWLPSVAGECLTVQTDPPGIKSSFSGSQDVEVILKPPIRINVSDWQCQYGSTECKPGGIPCNGTLSIDDSVMRCKITTRGAFVNAINRKADFKIVKKSSPSTVLAEGFTFLFFLCESGFSTCLDCLGDKTKGRCHWLTTEARCVNNPESQNTISYQDRDKLCPRLLEEPIKLPVNRQTNVLIHAENLPATSMSMYRCSITDVNGTVVNVTSKNITCEIKIDKDGPVKIYYHGAEIDNPSNVSAKVYNCEALTRSCSSCQYLFKEDYYCSWNFSTNRCQYSTNRNGNTSQCPPPQVTQILPLNGTIRGNTSLTINGTEFGSSQHDINITVSEKQCVIYDSGFYPKQWVKCYTGSVSKETIGGEVVITRNGKAFNTNAKFDYVVPKVLTIYPTSGIKAGGRILTIKGVKLHAGNLDRGIVTLWNRQGAIQCPILHHPSILIHTNVNELLCAMDKYSGPVPWVLTDISVTFDDVFNLTSKVNFTYVDNPSVNITRNEAIKSGGVQMNITGERFKAVSVIKIGQEPCQVINDNNIRCPVPQYNSSLASRRRRRSTDTCPCYQFSTIHMDNFEYDFRMVFQEDPVILPFGDTVHYSPGASITIEGRDLLRGAIESDYQVLVQSALSKTVKINPNGTRLTFEPPDFLSEGNEYQVEVMVGSRLRQHIGVIYYQQDFTITYIVSGLGGLVFALLLIIGFCCYRNRRKDSQLSKLQNNMLEMEDNIRITSREVFADLQMSMQDIKGDLVATGIPYFDYHNYSFHTLFPKLKTGECIYFQASADRPVEDLAKIAPKGIMAFGELLKNKFFLQSLIGTLERQNKFSMQEKAEFSSLLTLILIGKMSYLSEVIEELLKKLIAGATRKQHRVLFRRSDSITQKLLSDWLALSLFPYLKGGGGQQLFMLYKATQTVMEKGPIDAVTLEAKETLAEERLLKMDLTYEPLTLKVDLNGKREHRYEVTVLDCDTITQVKAKCMFKIYKNKAASELQFSPEELILEWHAGKGGRLVLNDIDRTSIKREGYVCRNTLRHYNVKNGSCMALLISDEPMDQEVFPNSESASINDVLLGEQSVTSYMSMSPEKQWHISFPEEDEKERGTHLHIQELYLNRLLHTKLKLVDYINAVFENVLDENRVPPVVCYLFKRFEELAKEQNVDPEVVSYWKSECYAMRMWSFWISHPDLLFDIVMAKHVIPCLDVIKSVFSDVFSRTSSKLTKDSSSAKLLFASEVPKYQERMKRFYEKLGTSLEPVTKQQFGVLMEEISQEQQKKIRMKKLPALKKLFSMVKKYSDEIISDLEEARETSDLKLAEKYDTVVQQIDSEIV